jgi:cyclophilin family peptidyl-prolyl cis-trans isomerase
MARLSDQANPKRDSSGSQFYIALAPLPQLDAQYTVFGQAQAASMPIVSQLRQGDGILTVLIEEK